MHERVCEGPGCAKTFIPTTANQKYCPPTERDRQRCNGQPRSRCARRASNAQFRGVPPTFTVPERYDCAHCGKACIPGENVAPQASKFCCNKHKKQWHRDREWGSSKGKRKLASARARLERAAKGKPSTVTKWTAGPCAECGENFVSKQASAICCCDAHSRRRRRRRQSHNRAKVYGWNDSNRARARRNGVEYETIRVKDVFKRDAYRCGICLKQTDHDARVPDPRAPTLDHVIPMSKGGPHTYDNVQCACFECNWRKCDRVPELQLAFVA